MTVTSETIEVIAVTRPNMFIVNDNMYNMMGYGELEKLFTIENYKTKSKVLQLYYPERYLNVIEQRVLIKRIINAGYEKVQIITHSTFIIQTSKNVKIFQPNDNLPTEKDFKLSIDNVCMPDDSGLNVL